jgi:hypothetical protein
MDIYKKPNTPKFITLPYYKNSKITKDSINIFDSVKDNDMPTTGGLPFTREVLKETPRNNYVEKYERWTPTEQVGGPTVHTTVCYTPEGHYIGEDKVAKLLCDKHGIKPELASPDNKVCSIGFCEKDNKWYGWSHRALVGFKIGDKLFEEEFGDDKTPYIEHGKQTINTLDDAKESAKRFAKSVASIANDRSINMLSASWVVEEYYMLPSRFRTKE